MAFYLSNSETCHSRKRTGVKKNKCKIKWTMAEFYSAASVSGSWYWASWFTITLSWRTGTLSLVLVTPVLFPQWQNVCCKKGLLQNQEDFENACFVLWCSSSLPAGPAVGSTESEEEEEQLKWREALQQTNTAGPSGDHRWVCVHRTASCTPYPSLIVTAVHPVS